MSPPPPHGTTCSRRADSSDARRPTLVAWIGTHSKSRVPGDRRAARQRDRRLPRRRPRALASPSMRSRRGRSSPGADSRGGLAARHRGRATTRGLHDVREPVAHAALGGVLAAGTLRNVADTIGGALRARAALDDPEKAAPLLQELGAAIDPALAPVAESVQRAIEDDGSDLRDTASPKLRKLRGQLRTGRQRVNEKLEQLVRSGGLREHLQEDFVTHRGGRPVLAVKESARRSVPGSSTTPWTPARRCSSSHSTSSISTTATRRLSPRSERKSSGSSASSQAPSATARTRSSPSWRRWAQSTWRSHAGSSRGVGAARPWRSRRRYGWWEHGIHSSTPRRRCRSISSWDRCAPLSSAARIRVVRRWR